MLGGGCRASEGSGAPAGSKPSEHKRQWSLPAICMWVRRVSSGLADLGMEEISLSEHEAQLRSAVVRLPEYQVADWAPQNLAVVIDRTGEWSNRSAQDYRRRAIILLTIRLLRAIRAGMASAGDWHRPVDSSGRGWRGPILRHAHILRSALECAECQLIMSRSRFILRSHAIPYRSGSVAIIRESCRAFF